MSEGIFQDYLDDEVEAQQPSEPSKAERKLQRKLERAQETGQLDPWERYRALTDLLRHYMDLVELADRKARFALVLIGAVNAINLVALARPELLAGTAVLNKTLVGLYLVVYICLSLFLFFYAIRELKPRLSTRLEMFSVPPGEILGLRFPCNVADSSRGEYYEKWRNAQVGQVNRELAYTVQLIARALTVKYEALESLFNGLVVLVFLTAGLLLYLMGIQNWS